MSKFELTISPDYVPGWTVIDAVREIFQNALDQEVIVYDNKMSWLYDCDNQQLSISNKSSVLNINSLLMGSSTKYGDENTIGQHGEGYKVATLVLLRNGKSVTFNNYGANQVWKPRFVKSRRYKSNILTFFVESHMFGKTHNNLEIIIENITEDDINSIIESNLHMQGNIEVLHDTRKGRILSSDRHIGKIYVNGLYVRDYDQYKYGYDFKPQYIKLDRDRKLVSDFDLKWLSSSMWSALPPQDAIELVKEGFADAECIQYQSSNDIRNEAYDSFVKNYGENAIPVSSQYEMEKVPSKYKPVVVNSNYCQLIKGSYKYKEPQKDEESIKNRLTRWYDDIVSTYEISMSPEHESEFGDILEMIGD